MGIPSKDMVKLLELKGVGCSGETLFYSKMPEEVDLAVAVLDTGGIDSNPLWKRDLFTQQFLVRGQPNKYDEAYNLAKAVKDALLGCKPVTVEGVDYTQFVMIGDITAIGYDDSNRPRFTLNFRILRENEPGGKRLDF